MDVLYNCEVEIEDALFKVSFDKGLFALSKSPVSLHNHGAYEVHVIEAGQFAFRINGSETVLGPGQCCVICPDVYHSKGNALAADAVKYCFKFEYVQSESDAPQIWEYLKNIDGICIYENCEGEIGLLKNLRVEMRDRGIGYRTSINSLASRLLVCIMRNICGSEKTNQDKSTDGMDENRSAVIDAFFALNHMNGIHARDLADILNLSTRQLGRVLQKQYGLTFGEKLIRIRVQAAKELLENSGMTVSRIAGTVGYNNTRYFNEAFKKVTGMTPMQYRNISTNRI